MKNFLFIILSLISFSSQAQEVDCHYGENISVDAAVIGVDSEHIFIDASRRTIKAQRLGIKPHILILDRKYNVLVDQELTALSDVHFSGFHFQKERLYVEYAEYDKTAKKINVYFHEMGGDGTLTDNKINIATIPTEIKNPRTVREYIYSPDGKKMAYVVTPEMSLDALNEPDNIKLGKNKTPYLIVLDENFKALAKQKLQVYKEGLYSFFGSFRISNNGDVIVRTSYNNKKYSNPTSSILLFKNNGTERVKIDQEIKGFIATDPKSGGIIGLRQEEEEKVGTRGITIYRYDKDLKITEEKTNLFSEELLNAIEPKYKSNKEEGLVNFFTEEMKVVDDGILVTLGYYKTSHSGGQYMRNKGLLLVLKINDELAIDWVAQVPKEQYSSNEVLFKYQSYLSSIHNGKLIVIWSDTSGSGKFKKPNIATIDLKTGNTKIKEFEDEDKKEGMMNPDYSKIIERENSILLVFRKKLGNSFCWLQF